MFPEQLGNGEDRNVGRCSYKGSLAPDDRRVCDSTECEWSLEHGENTHVKGGRV